MVRFTSRALRDLGPKAGDKKGYETTGKSNKGWVMQRNQFFF